ncbi:hypothetical protein EYF80_033141 [Liparis tanakae]|uniref:Uncharacterized protein n=1 Tax=Liparis tanakae TaxID=230148 RepID=A0A4Z2GVG2_9TELE|nr:hypothetical protein EYF80_033141 [Liparis tanakae]
MAAHLAVEAQQQQHEEEERGPQRSHRHQADGLRTSLSSLPDSATCEMWTPCSAAMKPRMENTTKPAKKLVPLLIRAKTKASLREAARDGSIRSIHCAPESRQRSEPDGVREEDLSAGIDPHLEEPVLRGTDLSLAQFGPVRFDEVHDAVVGPGERDPSDQQDDQDHSRPTAVKLSSHMTTNRSPPPHSPSPSLL